MNSGSNNPAERFEDLLTQLRLCHHKAIQELEEKVIKLKKERCLDAEKLEVFYVRNQQLREQNKALQEAIALLEGRLRAGACDRCATLEQDRKNNEDLNLHLVAKLQNERINLEGGNGKVHSDLHRLTVSRSHDQQTSPAEEEEGIIPDSPILPSSVPVAKRLRKRRNNRNKPVCYGELPLPQSRHLLFNTDGAKDSGGTEVLVPNTCDLHTEISADVSHELKEATAETPEHLRDQETKTAQGAESSSKVPSKCDLHLKSSLSSTLIHSPALTTERSPSLLPQTKWLSEHGTNNKAKRKKEQSEPEPDQVKAQRVQETVAKQKESNHTRPELTDQTSMDQSLIKKPLDNTAKKQRQEELVDTDCTWVRHSVLQGGQEQDSQPGLAEKAVDSLDMMFDNTTFGEYKTYDSSHEDQSQACDEDEDHEDEEDYDHGPETSPGPSKARQPTFAYAAVVRKKDERRKLQGVTCRECESYYADLPEEQKQKKLSMCSRHRFLYVPPCTPENFWEVGFPSTQTCIEKGYIKEDDNQEARSRRRQPLNALFSPKRNQQES